MKQRIDLLLVDRGLAASRERAQALILAGRVLVDEQKVEKPGTRVTAEAAIRLLGEDLKYVSRGGLKLEAALDHWHLNVAGHVCLDVGASTGGFTDCLLQRGAAHVIAIDTGYGQIDSRLRSDPRVHLLEKTNARHLHAADLPQTPAPITFLAMDVSFISATLVLPAVIAAIRDAHVARAPAPATLDAVVLVKPQFEAGREQVGKGGIVRDAAVQQAAVEKVRASMQALGFVELEVIESPILGGEGNREFLLRGSVAVGRERATI
jgi:23S rRNA (cytidine1920-2'-O)/16S rRNA (cytidine1409-2'-O)-methyltransferase